MLVAAGLPATASQQPLSPRLRLLPVPRVQERQQGKGGVAQPAVAVVPVAHPAAAPAARSSPRPRCHRSARTSALLVMRERRTSSRHGPVYVHRPDHCRHHSSVSLSASPVSRNGGIGSCEGCQVSVNPTRCPADTRKSATQAPFSPRRGTLVRKRKLSGRRSPRSRPRLIAPMVQSSRSHIG